MYDTVFEGQDAYRAPQRRSKGQAMPEGERGEGSESVFVETRAGAES